MFIDFHCHYVVNNAIYCTARPNAIEDTTKAFLYCHGLLPQYWTSPNKETLIQNLQKPNIQLGEAGLDKRFQHQISMQTQEENLLTILQYATKHEKIITIHSVQATERTIDVLKQTKPKPWKTIWHGFNGSLETAELLYKMGVFISIGPRYNKQNLKELAEVHPNFVLETDFEPQCQESESQQSQAQTLQNYTSILQTHYQNCALQLKWTVEDLKEHCYGQAQTLTN